MLDIPFKALPAPLLGGLFAYAVLCALWLQPLVERRMAAKTFMPQCESGAIRAQNDRRQSYENEIRLQERILQQLLDHPLSQLPMIRDHVLMVKEVLDGKKKAFRRYIDHSSRCACAVTSAFDGIRFQMLLHVMSARTYASAQLAALPFAIGQNLGSAACGADGK
jgi:hypothetical protein